jgi:hypothetical protein
VGKKWNSRARDTETEIDRKGGREKKGQREMEKNRGTDVKRKRRYRDSGRLRGSSLAFEWVKSHNE